MSDKFRGFATNQLNSMINVYWDKYCSMIRSRFEAEVIKIDFLLFLSKI